jgi:DtxR family Mn-dependent transcriptional regulator
MEDYLEAILVLEKKNRVARVKDIAAMLDVQMPSVTGALKNLRDRNLIDYEKNSFINLTDMGLEKAKKIKKKHGILLSFMEIVLNESGEEAEKEACSWEHHLSTNVANKIQRVVDYIEEGFETGRITPDEWNRLIEG